MASITENQSAVTFSYSFGATLTAWSERFALYRKFNATKRELNALSNRELADLGLTRSNINSIAYEAIYGA